MSRLSIEKLNNALLHTLKPFHDNNFTSNICNFGGRALSLLLLICELSFDLLLQRDLIKVVVIYSGLNPLAT